MYVLRFYLKLNKYLLAEVSSNVIKHGLLHEKPVDCAEILENGETSSGEYKIWPRNRIIEGKELLVYCDMDTDGGGWTVIQRRGTFSKKIDFHRNWADYKKGFGNISEEFWSGNDNIFALTSQRNYVARFDMKNVGKEYRFATYSSFWIDDENSGYKLHFGNYFGTAGDGIKESKNMQFSTKDKQYHKANKVCPNEKMGGWWYNHCGLSNPNGINRPEDAIGKKFYMNWYPWTKYNSLLMIEIKIRPEK
ncbi:unnamed protein product [Larinioides sclopetarius]|uniref:Fibrinogen C-terminal domain-containing protein n=1 Tax=Larinioides sclopetarius TaxID=280406 RepID=A0AAV1Z0V1_9ARAC